MDTCTVSQAAPACTSRIDRCFLCNALPGTPHCCSPRIYSHGISFLHRALTQAVDQNAGVRAQAIARKLSGQGALHP